MMNNGFGKYLKNLRQMQNLSQVELAEKLNVSNKAVSKWENERGFPDIGNLKAIAVLFNLTVDEVLNQTVSVKDNDLIPESRTEEAPDAGVQGLSTNRNRKKRNIIFAVIASLLIIMVILTAVLLPQMLTDKDGNDDDSGGTPAKTSQTFYLKKLTVAPLFSQQFDIDPDDSGDNADYLASALLFIGKTLNVYEDKILFDAVSACGLKNPAYYSTNNGNIIFADDELKSIISSASISDDKIILSLNNVFITYIYEYILGTS